MTLNPQLVVLKEIVINNKYLYYFMSSNFFKYQVSSNIIGGSTPAINQQRIGSFRILIPSSSEQKDIVSFLDNKTKQIDEIVSKKQKLINLLQEERAAIINEAVTRGVNLKVKCRKSKLNWLNIPEHWKEFRAKKVFFESMDQAKGDEELLSVSHYTGVTPRSEKNVNMFLAESYEGYKLCKKDDLVINIMWAWMGALGVSEYDGIVSSGYGVYRLKNSNTYIPKYLDYLLRTPGYICEYTRRSKGVHSSRWRMYSDEFFQIPIICPSLEEQEDIVNYIQRETHKINLTVIKYEKEIVLLEEYKSALVSEAVTGKIDVREEVIS